MFTFILTWHDTKVYELECSCNVRFIITDVLWLWESFFEGYSSSLNFLLQYRIFSIIIYICVQCNTDTNIIYYRETNKISISRNMNHIPNKFIGFISSDIINVLIMNELVNKWIIITMSFSEMCLSPHSVCAPWRDITIISTIQLSLLCTMSHAIGRVHGKV